MGKEFRMPETAGAAFLNREVVSFRWFFRRTVWDQGRDQGIACLERFFQTLKIVRLSVIETVQGSDVKDNFLEETMSPFLFGLRTAWTSLR